MENGILIRLHYTTLLYMRCLGFKGWTAQFGHGLAYYIVQISVKIELLFNLNDKV
jgi:hypothetical protein